MLTIANFISLSRIVLVPVIIFFMVHDAWNLALFIFIAAALTDLLDGFVARRSKTPSKFGKILDPLADKILLCSVMIAMLVLHDYLRPILYFLLCKELLLLAGGAYLWCRHKKFIAPSKLSRFVAILEICFVLFMFAIRLNIFPASEFIFNLFIFLLIFNVLFSVCLLGRYVKIIHVNIS